MTARRRPSASAPRSNAGDERAQYEGRLSALFAILEARGLEPSEDQRRYFETFGDLETIECWLRTAAIAKHIDDLLVRDE